MGLDWLYNPIAIPRDIFKGAKDLVSGGGSDSAPAAPPAPAPLPEPPKQEDAAASAQENVKRRKAAQTKTVFTDPLGVSGQADIVRKTLTGQ